jgi:hypothetical protein
VKVDSDIMSMMGNFDLEVSDNKDLDALFHHTSNVTTVKSTHIALF